jgi:hypothetical protein
VPSNFYAAVSFNRTLLLYDYIEKKLLCEIKINHADQLFMIDNEQIICVQDGDSIQLYSIKMQIEL